MRHILYIINPISGTGGKESVQALVEARTREAGIDFSIEPSVRGGDYSHLFSIVKERGVTDVVIAGGDGTVNQVINSLRGQDVQFGILPCGSGNGLAYGAGIPRNKAAALEIILQGKSQPTDAFTINGQFACMLVGLGFDAQVAHDFAEANQRGLMTYIKKTVTNFFTAHCYPFTIQSGGEALQAEAFFISVANSNQFGNNFTIAPQASLTDGLLDVVVVTNQHKLNLLLQTLRQVGGFNRLQEKPVADGRASVLYFQTDHLTIHNPSLAPMHIDGDPAETTDKLEMRVLHDCYRLICP